jgi:3-oxoacyl-[acyl-carrier-protein] synthase-3
VSIRIQATGISAPNGSIGSIAHAVLAAKNCIAQAGVALNAIDLMVNVGVYRDNNLCEPSVCALIQNRLGLCLNPEQVATGSMVLSFDLMNGACGLVNALQVVDAVLHARGLERALLVSSDAHPSGEQPQGFPIAHAGAALLVERSPNSAGFQAFSIQTSERFEGQLGFCDLQRHGKNSRFCVEVQRDPTYVEHLLAFSKKQVAAFIQGQNLDPEDLELIVSQPSPGFAAQLAESLGAGLAPGAETLSNWGDTHTSALGLGCHLAMEKSAFESGKQVLLVGAGTGLTVACALYGAAA